MTTVLDRLTAAHLHREPFHHYAIEEALPEALFTELADSFPSLEYVAGTGVLENNRPYLKSASEVLADDALPAAWRAFFEAHTAPAFFKQLLTLWGDAMRAAHPRLEDNFGKPLEDFTIGVRAPGKWDSAANRQTDVVLDCLFGVNSPVKTPTPARGPHVDSPAKLFSTLLYLRDPEDDCEGGAFELYAPKGRLYPKRQYKKIPDHRVARVKQVPYQANTLVGWLNGARAIHAVEPRSVTERPRRYIAITAECYGGREARGHFLHDPSWSSLTGRLRNLF